MGHPAPEQNQQTTKMQASISACSKTGPDAKTYILLSLLGEQDTKTSEDPGYATEFKFQAK